MSLIQENPRVYDKNFRRTAYKSCNHPFLLIDVNLHLVDGEDAHPLEADSEGGSPHSVTLAGVQGGVQQLHAAVLSEEHNCLFL